MSTRSEYNFPSRLASTIGQATPPRSRDTISAFEIANSVQERILAIKNGVTQDPRFWSERGICCALAGEKPYTITDLGKTITTQGSPVFIASGTLWFVHMATQEGMRNWKARGIEQEANVCATIYRRNGFDVRFIKVAPILRDWSGSRASSDSSYQPYPIGDGRWVEVWDDDRCRGYLTRRVVQHIRAEDGDVQLCSDDERWRERECYKVFKPGGKRALRTLDTKAGAEMWRDEYLSGDKTRKANIVHVKSEAHRCQKAYCSAFSVCKQGKTA